MNSQLGFDFESESLETVEQKKKKLKEEKAVQKKAAEELKTARDSLRDKLTELSEFDFSKLDEKDSDEVQVVSEDDVLSDSEDLEDDESDGEDDEE